MADNQQANAVTDPACRRRPGRPWPVDQQRAFSSESRHGVSANVTRDLCPQGLNPRRRSVGLHPFIPDGFANFIRTALGNYKLFRISLCLRQPRQARLGRARYVLA
jgi:hypothetical protein